MSAYSPITEAGTVRRIIGGCYTLRIDYEHIAKVMKARRQIETYSAMPIAQQAQFSMGGRDG